MNKAVFIDRDGVINNDEGLYYISDPDDFKLNPGIGKLLAWIKSQGFLLIVISNQGGISRGLYTKSDVVMIDKKMTELLFPYKVGFDEIYYCPHHPDNENCLCRKPGTVQIEKAVSRFSINLNQSFFIGDRETDVETGKRAGLKTIKVDPNQDMSLVIERLTKETGIS